MVKPKTISSIPNNYLVEDLRLSINIYILFYSYLWIYGFKLDEIFSQLNCVCFLSTFQKHTEIVRITNIGNNIIYIILLLIIMIVIIIAIIVLCNIIYCII